MTCLFLISAILIILLQRYKWKLLLFAVPIVPFGYVMSIYRHIRGELYTEGMPSIEYIVDLIGKVLEKDPPSIEGFLLGISESVNFNVIYEIFHSIDFNSALWGETFSKAFVFFIPRSLWSDKPLSITQLAGEWFAPQSEHLSLVTTLIGEAHANFHILGILFLPIILYMTDILFKNLFYESKFSHILLFTLGLLMFRMPYSDIVVLSMFVLSFYKLIILVKRKTLQ